jgi:hypothetical protein
MVSIFVNLRGEQVQQLTCCVEAPLASWGEGVMNQRSQLDSTQKTVKKREEAERLAAKRHLDEKLDAALEETFPASDAIQFEAR